MFTNTDLLLNTLNGANDKMAEERQAIALFEKAQRSAAQKRMFAFLTGRCTCLLSLSQVLGLRSPANRHYLGLQQIAINQIHGSEARTSDFDASFNPLSARTMQRWTGVLLARLNDTPLPPVDLIKVGEEYFVRDGHHRISVAHALGQEFIEPEVTEW